MPIIPGAVAGTDEVQCGIASRGVSNYLREVVVIKYVEESAMKIKGIVDR